MSVLSWSKTCARAAVVLVLCGPAVARPSGIGFQARLDDPPPVVSRYYDHLNRFSAAMRPLSYAPLSQQLLFNPKLEYSIFDPATLTFGTTYLKGQSLVPVSVDAGEYYKFRMAAEEWKKREQLTRGSIVEAQQGKQRQGLSIGVNLPKRFDQMFGEGGANLRVSGYRRITFSGRSQWDDAAGSGIRRQNKFPSLNMEQISRFDIQGTIGTKISVSVSQDNQTDIPLANRLIIRYKGDDDDILKAIEAGNTTLSIPNTQFVGYSQRIQGLFGLKTEAQLGNLNLIAIASQEKGSSESAVISATGEENAEFMRDYAYAEGRIYDLFYPNEDFGPNDSVRTIRVYEQELRLDNPDAYDIQLVIDPADPSPLHSKKMLMKQVETDKYELLYGQDSTRSRVAIVFYTQQNKALGVYMEIARYSAAGALLTVDQVGRDPDTLKFLQAESEDYLPNHPTWDLMWRNCYKIPKNVVIEDIEIKVFKGLPGREGTTSSLDNQLVAGVAQQPFVQILGLDQWNNNRQTLQSPDGLLDNRLEVFRPDWGLMIFPHRKPFDTDTTFTDQNNITTPVLALKVPTLYEYNSRQEKVDGSQYYIQSVTKARSAVIRLGRANIIEGSERVTLNGAVLQRDVDYRIEYDFGQVTLLTDEATDPNADVKVEFQYAPFISLQKKTLLGMRAEYEYSDDLTFGSTVLYKSDKAQDRKPRVGQETAKAMVLDFDINFRLHPNFITKAIDALPLISSEAPSSLNVSAEVAQSRPNPNVEGEAYVDDFEAAVEQLSLGILRTDWTMSSAPFLEDTILWQDERGTIRWHNPPPIARQDVYEGQTVVGQGSLQPLRLIFRPFADGCHGDTIKLKSWGGIQRSFGNRIDEKRVQLFEIRAKGGKGILHFDFGKISEDIDGDGRADSEDILRNNSLDVPTDENSDQLNEDVGLDTIPSEREVNDCDQGYHSENNPDPAGDNWWFNGYGKGGGSDNQRPPVPIGFWTTDAAFRDRVLDERHYLYYDWQNGTEGNIDDDLVQGLPDQEVLSRTRTSLSEINAYLTFTVPLDPVASPYIVPGSERNGWYTYRVPIREPGVVDTVNPDGLEDLNWALVTHARVWFERDPSAPDTPDSATMANLPPAELLYSTAVDSLWIAEWGFVQSNWRDTLEVKPANDTISDFYVASVTEDDGTFIPPPGVEPYYDKVNQVTETQKGLALIFDSLQPGALGVARKDLITTESYSGYRRMKMYVHGSNNLSDSDSLLFFLRLGRDSVNYYEYHTYVLPGWVEGNYVDIDFNEITALKDEAMRNLERPNDPVEDSTEVYRVVGRPNINEVRFIAAGVENRGPAMLSGQIWLDELRVTDVRKDVGNAARVVINGSAADLFTYGVSWDHKDPYFRGLSEATRGGSRNNLGSGQESNQISYSASLNVNKFLPRSWGARVPLSFRYSKAEQVPLLRSNSDVVLPDEVREQEKSVSTSYSVTTGEAFQYKGSNILFNALLNRQKVNFSYSRSNRKSVNNPYNFAESYNVRADYEMGVKKDISVPVFFWTRSLPILKKLGQSRMSFYPDTWTWSATYNRSLSARDDQDFNRTSSFSRMLDGKMTLSYKMFSNLTANYDFTTRRDLTDPDLVQISLRNLKLGIENSYNQNFRSNYDPKLLGFLTSAFTYQATYGDTWDRSSQTHNTSLSRNWGVSGSFRHQDLLGKGRGGKAAGSERARAGVRGGARDGTEEKKTSGPRFYEPVLVGLRFLTNWLQPVSYKYGESFNQTVPGATVKPGFMYRMGLATDPDFPTKTTSQTRRSGETVQYEFGSGFNFLGGIATTVAYRTQISRELVSAGRDRGETRTISWPDISLRIEKFKTLPLIKNYVNWFIDIFQPRTAYSRQVRETRNLDRDILTDRSTTINRNPLLSLNFRLLKSLSLSGTYTISESKDEKNNATTGRREKETRITKKTYGLTTKYQFSAPGGISIPLFGKLKFKSTVSVDVNLQYSSNLSESSTRGGPWVVFQDESNFSVSPVIRYAFSQQISGGLTARWQDSNNAKFNRRAHVRELQIWAEIHF